MTLAPRVEVFTQLACSQLVHPKHTLINPPFPVGLEPTSLLFDHVEQPWDNEDSIPKQPVFQCKKDPAVQAGAARIQTVYAMTMGLLSALTTGWWGHFGDRHGRMKVFAITSFGWFLTDVTFILAATPSSPLASSGETLILIAPVFEGIFGGWSTIQSVTAAYVSDCTSSGSRSSVFSRFTGVSFLGFALGPVVGAWLIRHPIALIAGRPIPGQPPGQSVISVFWIAALGSFINFCLVLFVFPESVSKEQHRVTRDCAVDAASPDRHKDGITTFIPWIIRDFFSPLATFIPTSVSVDGRQRRDWSLTFLACALFGHLLSAGLFQIKYLYGSHVYSWTPEQLSYYISFMGGGRALFLLFVLPLVISRFKPKSNLPRPPPGATGAVSKQKPTKEHLAREIKFDLTVARVSLCIDVVANAAIVLAPAPADGLYTNALSGSTDEQFRRSQALFVGVSWTAGWGAGLVPAAQSLALCIVQSRALVAAEGAPGSDAAPAAGAQTGKLFGALAILQATGQMIFGPMLFGLVYYNTVATFPKAVFVTAIGILLAALLATFLVRTPLTEASKAVLRAPIEGEEEEGRGRPRTSKDLGRASGSGGGYGSTSNAVSMQEPASPST